MHWLGVGLGSVHLAAGVVTWGTETVARAAATAITAAAAEAEATATAVAATAARAAAKRVYSMVCGTLSGIVHSTAGTVKLQTTPAD